MSNQEEERFSEFGGWIIMGIATVILVIAFLFYLILQAPVYMPVTGVIP
ncbi:MAG: hypothetical protein AAB710_02755 [Patescibacteria group bacterium]